MNGKDYVAGAIELTEKLIAEVRESNLTIKEEILDQAAQSCRDLDAVRNKATLRTKNGTNRAFPVMEAARNIEEAWEDARDSGDPDELPERFEEFSTASLALISALKERTVIMT